MAQDVGLIGLAVMGENLALNIERNGFAIAVYNRTYDKTKAFLEGRARGKRVVGARKIGDFVRALERPRRIITMVKAGGAVDAVLAELKPHLDKGDIVVDGGNSAFHDTDRRIAEMAKSGIAFVGMGVSGGEEGALRGPSMMPGGSRAEYRRLAPILKRIAAVADTGRCVTFCGRGSAGHFVKMVHNGIEYGDMQLIAEAYDLLRHGLGLDPEEIGEVFARWNESELQSFLIEVTAHVVRFADDKRKRGFLIDQIRDAAGQKGTGRWTTQVALDLGVPIPTITAAVDARYLSGLTDLRAQMARVHRPAPRVSRREAARAVAQVRAALYASKICAYAQGFHLLAAASEAFDYGTNLAEVARIWKAGCIIRAAFLDRVRAAFRRRPTLPSLLLEPHLAGEVRKRVRDWRATVRRGVEGGIALPAMSASLAYFDGIRRARGPANLIQAQRDFFGAHTYTRLDRSGVFHTDWSQGSTSAHGSRRPRR
jgi:6-phosphogluconate dehydrogenase